MTSISCRVIGDDDLGAYSALLESDSGNLLYATPSFLDFLRMATQSQVEVLVAERGGQIVGALPFAVCEAQGVGRIVNSLPWWGSHGSVVLNRRAVDADIVRTALLDAFFAKMKSLEPLSITMVLLPAEEAARPLYERVLAPNVTDGRIGQMSELPSDGPDLEMRLLATFQQKTRNLVRKGLKQGFREIVTDDEWAWDFLAATHATNVAALSGRAKPRDHFAAIRRVFPPAMRRLAVAMEGDAPVAGILTIAFNGTVEYITPVIEVAHRPRQPLSFLIFEAMREAIRNGARRWNWGGTWIGQPALHHFKAGFGAADHHYSYLIWASDEGLAFFRGHKAELGLLFPYFYVYPYGALT